MHPEDDTTIYLKDYAPSAYAIPEVELRVTIEEATTKVVALLTVTPREGTAVDTPLVLDADELSLQEVAIDGAPLTQDLYEVGPGSLTMYSPPTQQFVLETEVILKPESNTKLMGLYRSNGVWCTQCEPEGFRRISYFLDRPDVLSRYKVRLEADKKLAPTLLANGNLVEQGDLAGGRHFAVWEDPHPKPSYLFAMVAGDLGSITDTFTTTSGRAVDLAIYCEHGKEEQCSYAMDSLKRSMAWDEKRFGREYDLDIFNIVAVSDFNFGAMENKGLNIFNDRFVLAKPETASDADYAHIESIIAHEYFHNWTGNRITCRDWFQLCLKEGLTVFRDQEFTSDERSRAVKRIEDVRGLRMGQFPEDGGPLAHPARPDQYREINNFYTATVYQKGAEIVRMLSTFLGEAEFRKGTDLYFERHDGEATTIESWLKVFEDSSGRDLSQFGKWYMQAGTPEVNMHDSWDAETKTYNLTLEQSVAPTPGQPDKEPMAMPVKFGLLGPNGEDANWQKASGGTITDDMLVFDEPKMTFTFEGMANRPVPSLFRGFSAPIKLNSNLDQDAMLFLARHDRDPFNRWQALQDTAMALIITGVNQKGVLPADGTVAQFATALSDTLTDDALDHAFKAHALAVPTEANVAQALGHDIDPQLIHETRNALLKAVATQIKDKLQATYEALGVLCTPYNIEIASTQARGLRNQCLALLVSDGSCETAALARQHYESADNMTDRMAALSAIVRAWTDDAASLLADFKGAFAGDMLVYDKWLGLNAVAPDAEALDRIVSIYHEPDFPKTNPNRLRSLVGTFGMLNGAQFARADGAGFRFVATFCGEVDSTNPQVAARVLTAFRSWALYEPNRRAKAKAALEELASKDGLSRNVSDILSRTLEG